MIRLIIIALLTIGVMVFLSLYESVYLLYFEEDIADQYAGYGAIPLLLFLSFYLFYDRYTHSIKDNRFLDATKHSFYGVLAFGVAYYFFFIPVISGTIIMTNDLFARHENVLVKGRVIEKLDFSTSKTYEYELTVETSTTTITWDTNKIEIDKYEVRDSFEVEMKKGFWGLLSKRK
jgi:hypothetical protein